MILDALCTSRGVIKIRIDSGPNRWGVLSDITPDEAIRFAQQLLQAAKQEEHWAEKKGK